MQRARERQLKFLRDFSKRMRVIHMQAEVRTVLVCVRAPHVQCFIAINSNVYFHRFIFSLIHAARARSLVKRKKRNDKFYDRDVLDNEVARNSFTGNAAICSEKFWVECQRANIMRLEISDYLTYVNRFIVGNAFLIAVKLRETRKYRDKFYQFEFNASVSGPT